MEEFTINGQRFWLFAFGSVSQGLQFRLKSDGNFTVLNKQFCVTSCGSQLACQIMINVGSGSNSTFLGAHCPNFFLENSNCPDLSNGANKILQSLQVASTSGTNHTVKYKKAKCKGGGAIDILESFISQYRAGKLDDETLDNDQDLKAKLSTFLK